MPTVLLYAGDGAGPFVSGCFARRLEERGYDVRRVGPDDVAGDDWHADVEGFVLPGGADRPYLRDLAGPGEMSLHGYVRGGGRVFGSCAGGYYLARRVHFDADNLHVREPRPLAFFPGTAAGPVPGLAPPYRDHPDATACVGLTSGGHALYWGGFALQPDADADRFDVLDRYAATGDVAACRVRVGKGCVVLCGVHPEVSGEDFAAIAVSPSSSATAAELASREAERGATFGRMWEALHA